MEEESKINEVVEQIQKVLMMTLDVSVRLTAIEKFLFEKNIMLPGEYQEEISKLSEALGNNIQKKMEELATAKQEKNA